MEAALWGAKPFRRRRITVSVESRMSVSLLAIAVLLALAPQPAAAGTISIGWDPVTHPDLAGYRVYYGTAPGSYAGSVDAGNVTETTLDGLASCTGYHISVKAYTSTGTLSDEYSQEVTGWARPELSGTSVATLERSKQASVVVDGANFAPGAEVLVSTPGVTVNDVTVTSCTQLIATLSVSANAALGPVELTVVNNPSRAFGRASGLVAVVADASGPSISDLTAGPVGSTEATVTWSTDESATAVLSFRREGTSAWQTRTSGATARTSHSVELTGLEPETTYEYHVQATDGGGNETASQERSFTTMSSPYTYLRIEAEMGELDGPVELVTSPTGSAFRGGWIRQKANTSNGTPTTPTGVAVYGFHVPHDARWRVWLRMAGDSTTSNGWYERMDGGGYQGLSPQPNGSWQWIAARSYDLTAGLHDLRLGGHEQRARLDRILITDDPDFVPSEAPGSDIVPPQQVSELAVAVGDGLNTLRWIDPDDDDATTLVIRYRTDGRKPRTPVDGMPLAETDVVPGSPGVYDHDGLGNGTRYTYSVFTIDASANASDARTIDGTPATAPPSRVNGLRRIDTL